MPIEPILEPDKFDRIYGYLAYRDAGNVVVGEAPFENDDAAIAAARAWLIDHFGALPSGVELNVTSVLHSSSGRASPAFEWDVGHTIAFEEAFHGVPVHAAGAVVYISGRTQFRASVTLLNFSPVAGSMTNVVNRAAAIDTVIQTMNASGTAPVNPAELQTRIDPQLHFVSLPMSGRYGQALQVLGPNWALDAEGRMLIDARTGRIWEND